MAIQEWRKGTIVTAAELNTLRFLADKVFEVVEEKELTELLPYIWGFRNLMNQISEDLIDERRSG